MRRLVLASSAPQGASGMHGWAPDVIEAVGAPAPTAEGVLKVFYSPSRASQQAGQRSLGRMQMRTTDRDKATPWETRLAQYDGATL